MDGEAKGSKRRQATNNLHRKRREGNWENILNKFLSLHFFQLSKSQACKYMNFFWDCQTFAQTNFLVFMLMGGVHHLWVPQKLFELLRFFFQHFFGEKVRETFHICAYSYLCNEILHEGTTIPIDFIREEIDATPK
jgi:hypothetical protein